MIYENFRCRMKNKAVWNETYARGKDWRAHLRRYSPHRPRRNRNRAFRRVWVAWIWSTSSRCGRSTGWKRCGTVLLWPRVGRPSSSSNVYFSTHRNRCRLSLRKSILSPNNEAFRTESDPVWFYETRWNASLWAGNRPWCTARPARLCSIWTLDPRHVGCEKLSVRSIHHLRKKIERKKNAEKSFQRTKDGKK